MDLENNSHRRLNPLNGRWVQVSPNRTDRPWQGQEESPPPQQKPRHKEGCYLCPGNERAGGVRNPDYESTFVFDNDFSSLRPDVPGEEHREGELLAARGERGICRVICFTPRHDLSLPEMENSQVEELVELWTRQYRELGERPFINYVQIFENKGEMMGCSNPHPHGQIYAQETVPEEPAAELEHQTAYYRSHGATLLGAYLEEELEREDRIVLQNGHFVALVPWWAYWPFETMIVSRRPLARFTDLRGEEREALAAIIHRLTVRYDNLFEVSFPYSAGFHPAPTDGRDYPQWHFHMHFYPPLLRSATVKKFKAGYEMLANPQRDFTPEFAAGRLRETSDVHFRSA
ncbi:MAG: UDP-glucose--hexose-1-phosphate uridylyltransferase [Balneolaceae bacterium]|nr:UDP-glucose--hexose-1-phosphate uridylyltransferase [Balneolaceae bacterium]